MALKRITKLKFSEYFKRSYSACSQLVDLNVNDKTGYATLEMQRPPVNSLNLDLLSDISLALDECENNKCRGLILTSKSDGVFSAGLDLFEMYKPDSNRIRKFWTVLQDTWIKLYGTSYPTVALINGHAPAGGCLLSCSTEYRIMHKKFTIGLNETKLGIVAPTWFIDSMRNVIGFRQSELALTSGHMFTTEEALKVGLIDEVVEDKSEGITRAEAFLSRFSKVSLPARAITKSLTRGEYINKLVHTKKEDMDIFLEAVYSAEIQKSLGIYLEALKKKGSSK